MMCIIGLVVELVKWLVNTVKEKPWHRGSDEDRAKRCEYAWARMLAGGRADAWLNAYSNMSEDDKIKRMVEWGIMYMCDEVGEHDVCTLGGVHGEGNYWCKQKGCVRVDGLFDGEQVCKQKGENVVGD